MSGKEHCSLGEALNPAVSSAVLAYCNRLCIKTEYVFKKCHYGTVKISHYENHAAHTWLLCWALH